MEQGVSNLQLVTLIIAIIGAILGVINTWLSIDKSSIKLKVTPMKTVPFGNMDSNIQFGIEITNLSAFPVNIDEAGVFFKGTDNRGVIINPILSNHGKWPQRLDSRSSITVFSQLPENKEKLQIQSAFAKTQCGVIVRGTSPALKQISEEGLTKNA